MRQALWSLVLLAASSMGCAAGARYMSERNPPVALQPAPGQALVVFVRPSGFAGAISANILDERGTFLGDIAAKAHFGVSLPPGPHMFLVWAENTDVLMANLVPGRIYFVEVYPSMGVWSAHMNFRAIKPGTPGWAERDGWIVGTRQFLMSDPAGAQANLEKKGSDKIAERLRRAREAWDRASGQARFERTLAAEDGL